jgi:hypothetical protein
MADRPGEELGLDLGLVLERDVVDVAVAADLADRQLVQRKAAVGRVVRAGGRLDEA